MKKTNMLPSLVHLLSLGTKNKYARARRYIAEFRALRRLEGLPRYQPASTLLLGRRLQLVDAASFLSAYHQIFKRNIYRFASEIDSPRIIDGGANIGLSVIYFKQLFPHSRITAFEPDAQVFSALRANMKTFGYEDIELVPKALWSANTKLTFMAEGADGGRIARSADLMRTAKVQPKFESVATVCLRDYLAEPVDFLKLDIEGAETEVLLHCADLLANVKHLFVEYHSFKNEPQSLPRLLQILTDNGFRFHLHSSNETPMPFLGVDTMLGMDLLLNIFAYREPQRREPIAGTRTDAARNGGAA